MYTDALIYWFMSNSNPKMLNLMTCGAKSAESLLRLDVVS